MRFERKFISKSINNFDLNRFLINNNFKNIYPSRFVNSIYYDTIDLCNYFESVHGIVSRNKARLRFYNDDIKNIILENKIKNSDLGIKKYKEFYIGREGSFPLKMKSIIKKNKELIINIPKKINDNLFPILLVVYKRDYYESIDNKLRITLDYNLRFASLRNINQNKCIFNFLRSDIKVVEMKYSKNLNQERIISQLSNYFNLNLSRFSKYCTGIEMTF